MSDASKVPNPVMWSADPDGLSKEEGLRMEVLRLAIAVTLETKGTSNAAGITGLASKFYTYVTTTTAVE